MNEQRTNSKEWPDVRFEKVGRLKVKMVCIKTVTYTPEDAEKQWEQLQADRDALIAAKRVAVAVENGLSGALYAEEHPAILKRDRNARYAKEWQEDDRPVSTIQIDIPDMDPEIGEQRKNDKGKLMTRKIDVSIYARKHWCGICGRSYHNSTANRGFCQTGKSWRLLGKGSHKKCCPECLPVLRAELHRDEEIRRDRIGGNSGLIPLSNGGYAHGKF